MVDLHLHSSASDGTFSPQELVQLAFQLNFKAIAITDHDSVEGVAPALKAQEKYEDLEVVPAVEITSYPKPETEHHILGYFVDYKDKNFQKALSAIRSAREERSKKVVKNLNKLGFLINFGDVKALASGTIVAPHIAWVVINDSENREKLKKEAEELTKKVFKCSSYDEALTLISEYCDIV